MTLDARALAAAAASCIARNEGRSVPSEQDIRHGQWAVAGMREAIAQAKREATMEVLPPLATSRDHRERVTDLGGPPKEELQARAKAMGYLGDACTSCGNFTLLRNGTCMKCDTCGSTTGCS